MQECAMLAFMDVTSKYTCSKHSRGYAPQPNGYEAKHIIKRMVVVSGWGNEQWNEHYIEVWKTCKQYKGNKYV